MNGGDPPSPDAVRCCPLCRRLYSSHATYNRHVLYCRKARARPRTRTISCRSCMAAKAKCTSETPCQRCTKKGILCVYASPGLAQERSRHDPPPPAVEPASIPLMTPHSSAGTPFAWNDLFREGTSIPPGGEQPGQPWDAGDIVSAGSSTSKVMDYTMPLSYAQNWEIALADDGHQLPGAFSPEPPTPETTMSAESSPQESTALVMSEIPDTAFLARVPIGNPVLHFTSTLVMQNLRAFVQMMARKETFPPFIHSHWYQKSTTGTSALPEPLVNCMGVAQMFASRTRETKQFLWRTVRMEQRSFIQKQDDQSYSACELLAAIQAQIIYIIMRAVDDEHLELDLNQEMVVTHQVLCESFARMLNQPFCRDERRFPSSSWEEWVFAESRRRTVYVWFLIAQIFRVKTGVPCAVLNGYRSLPLTSPKALWEARTRLEWQTEYQTYQVLPRIGLETFGDLVHACKDGIAVRCDAWNATADNLGMLLRLGAQMMTCDF